MREPKLAPCGTWSAYCRHSRRGEPADEACRAAAREHERNKPVEYKARKAKRQARRRAERVGEQGPNYDDRDRPCNLCEQVFTPATYNQRYCSALCRERAREARRSSRTNALGFRNTWSMRRAIAALRRATFAQEKTCGRCGESLDYGRRPPDPLAPVLSHRRGYPITRENVRAEHYGCEP